MYLKQMWNSLFSILACIIWVGTHGCATQPKAFNKKIELSENQAVLADSRSRMITNTTVKKGTRPGLVNPERIICAEPSPDVALAVAGSFGFGLSVFGYGSGSFSATNAEGLAQLAERTASIQLLRDQMYRACEAYANGAITGTTYNLIMSKNNDSMISLLMGETAGGAFGRSLAAVGGGATAESTATLDELSQLKTMLEEVENELKEGQKAVDDAKEEVEDKEKIAEGDEEKSEMTQEKNDESVDEAEKELAAAEEIQNKLEKRKADTMAKMTAQIDKIVGAGSITAKPTAVVARELGNIQENYLEEDFTDEFVAACIIELGLAPAWSGNVRKHESDIRKIQGWILKDYTEPTPNFNRREWLDFYERFSEVSKSLERTSALADFCNKNLMPYVFDANTKKHNVDLERIQLEAIGATTEQMNAKADALQAMKGALAACGSLPDGEVKTRCLSAATQLVEVDGDLIGVTSVETITVAVPSAGELGSTHQAYAKAKDMKKDYEKKKATLKSAEQIPTPKKDELKDTQKKLVTERANLTKKTEALDSEIASHIDSGDNGKEDQVENFERDLMKLMNELGRTAPDDKLTWESLELEIQAKKIEGRKKRLLLDALAAKMAKLGKNINAHMKMVNNYIKANDKPAGS